MKAINLDRREALKSFKQFAVVAFGGFMLLKQDVFKNPLQNNKGFNLSTLKDLKAYINLNVNLANVCKEAFIYKDYEIVKKYFLYPSLYYKAKDVLFKTLRLENTSLTIKAPSEFIKALENMIEYDKNSKSLTQFTYQREFIPYQLDVSD